MLLCSKGTNSIQVIILDFPEFEEVVEWDGMAFKEMKNLKTLNIRVGSFSKGPEYLPNSLRVLEWSGYPSPSLPPNFHPKKLVILKLRQSFLMSLDFLISKKVRIVSSFLLSKISTNPFEYSFHFFFCCYIFWQKFVSMRVLNFDDVQCIAEIPDVSGAPNLEELSFGDIAQI